ncbi:MAG: peroxiredoxin [Pseudomonadales bacterium]
MRLTILLPALVLVLGLGAAAAAHAADGPQVGDLAPDFDLPASDGNRYRLADFRGQQAVVLAWFPKAYTQGCTIECKSLTENGHLIREFDVSYFMASVDNVEDNTGFAAELNADFPLLSDPGKQAARAYGVLSEAGFARRHTYYIGADGRILAIDRNVRPATSAEDMAAMLAELEVARR